MGMDSSDVKLRASLAHLQTNRFVIGCALRAKLLAGDPRLLGPCEFLMQPFWCAERTL